MMRYTVYFSGRVQGVGFRYTTKQIARDFDVAGYVKNLDDGRVELVAEGDKAALDGLLAAIRERMASNIRDVKVDRTEGTGAYGVPGQPRCKPLSIVR